MIPNSKQLDARSRGLVLAAGKEKEKQKGKKVMIMPVTCTNVSGGVWQQISSGQPNERLAQSPGRGGELPLDSALS